MEAGGSGGGEEGDEFASFAGDLAEAFEHGEVLLAVLGVELFEVGHAVKDGGGEGVEHGGSGKKQEARSRKQEGSRGGLSG